MHRLDMHIPVCMLHVHMELACRHTIATAAHHGTADLCMAEKQ